jgi:hypothetical protein
MKTMLVLPYGSVVDYQEIVGFDFNPPPGDDLDVPPGYVHFRNGQTKPILPGDAWVLMNWFKSETAIPENCIMQLKRSDAFETRLKAAEERNKRLAEERKKATEIKK